MNIFTIKIIALILMLMDHIGEFFPDSPIWFRWLGRLAAPLFFYALAVGFRHTRNRKKYLLRLYLANVGMVFLIRLCVCCRENWTMWRINRKIIIYLQPCFVLACLSVYGKAGKRRKSFYIHWNIYLLAGYGNGTCNSGRGV